MTPPIHSYLSPTIGSTRAARRDRIHAAMAAVSVSTTIAAISDKGSSGVTPNNSPFTIRVTARPKFLGLRKQE
jgi:hypothetical protein